MVNLKENTRTLAAGPGMTLTWIVKLLLGIVTVLFMQSVYAVCEQPHVVPDDPALSTQDSTSSDGADTSPSLAGGSDVSILLGPCPPPYEPPYDPPPPTPGTPSYISASGDFSNGNYTISWGSSSYTTSAGYQTTYQLYESKNGGAWSLLAVTGVSTRSYTVSNRGDGTYQYRVRARTRDLDNQTSSYSGLQYSAIYTVLRLPGLPSEIAVPTSIDTDGAYSVSWTQPTDSAISRYELVERYRLNSGATWGGFATVYSGTGRTATRTGRADGLWQYGARACSASGCGGYRYSTAVQVLRLPSAPSSITVPTGTDADGAYTVSWGLASGNWVNYRLYERKRAVGTSTTYGAWAQVYAGAGLSKALTGRSDGYYDYYVVAYNTSGTSAARHYTSEKYVLFKPGVPSSITLPTGTDIDGAYTVSWGSATGNFVNYRLYERKRAVGTSTPYGAWAQVYAGSALSTALSGRGDGYYDYYVVAYNAGGTSAARHYNLEKYVLHKPGTPSSILVPTAIDSDGTYSVNWGAVSGSEISRYELVERYRVNSGDTWGAYSTVYSGITYSILRYTRADGYWQYGLRACNASGCGSYKYSTEVQVLRVPGVPSSITVPTGTDIDGAYTVSWGSASGTVSGYRLYERKRAIGNGTPYGAWAQVYAGSALSKALSGRGQGYYDYFVVAYNAGGTSVARHYDLEKYVLYKPSTPSSITVPTDIDVDGIYTVSWGASSGSLLNYRLYERKRAIGSTAYSAWAQVYVGPGISKALSGKTNGYYDYYVVAYNAAGTSAARHYDLEKYVLFKPGVPSSITLPTGIDADGAYTVSWGSATGSLVNYKLYERKRTIISTTYSNWALAYNGAGRSAALTGRTDGYYDYYVVAYNAAGTSAARHYDLVKSVLHKPGTPSSITVPAGTDVDGAYTVSWGSATGSIVSYRLYERKRAAGTGTTYGAWALVYNGASLSIALSGKTDGYYDYYVVAYNASGTSAARNYGLEKYVLFKPGTPSSITVPTGTDGDGAYTVSWGASSGSLLNYRLYERKRAVGSGTAYGAWAQVYNGAALNKALSGRTDGYYDYYVVAYNASGASAGRHYNLEKYVLFKPNSPASISVPTGTDFDGAYTVSWGAASGNYVNYKLYERKRAVGTGTPYGSWVLVYGGTALSRALTGKTDGYYDYYVIAFNPTGSSAARHYDGEKYVLFKTSTPSSITVPTGTDIDGAYTVSWGAASGSLVKYRLYERRRGAGTSTAYTSWAKVYDGSALSTALNGKTDGYYDYYVVAYNASGTSAAVHYGGEKYVLFKPGTPASITVPTGTDTDGAYSVSWGAGSGSLVKYKLFERKRVVGTGTAYSAWAKIYDGAALSSALSAKGDGYYDYYVLAYNASGSSANRHYNSEKYVLRDASAPSSITVPGGVDNDGAYSVSWGAATGSLLSYRLFERKRAIDDTSFSAWTQVYDGTALSKALTGKTDGYYDYYVNAYNTNGSSANRHYNSEKYVLFKPGVPASITVPSGTDNDGAYTVTWEAATGNVVNYRLFERVRDLGIGTPYSAWTQVSTGDALSKALTGKSDGYYDYYVEAFNDGGSSAKREYTSEKQVLNESGPTGWNADTHELVSGDFNNDGRDDILYVSKDPASRSGIVLADESGELSILHQEWDSDHLGITWHSAIYNAHVGDFNGDGFADVFMDHKDTGSNHVFHTNADGRIELLSQRSDIANTALGLDWGSSVLVFGDYNGDGRQDIYLQPKDPQTASRLVFADTSGRFSAISDTWSNEHLGFQWSQMDAVVVAGDFNGVPNAAGYVTDELLVQAKPDWVLLPHSDLSIPVQRFAEFANGIIVADEFGLFSSGVTLDFWNNQHLNLDWSPENYEIIVGDFDNDGQDDILLQALREGQESFVLLADANGQFSNLTEVSQTLDSSYSATVYEITTGDFSGDGATQLYLQAVSTTDSNFMVSNVGIGSAPSQVLHNPDTVTHTPPASNSGTSPAGLAVGKLPGQFSVSATGAANYRIPINVPAGVGGMQPELALMYNSNAGNGQLGIGWSLSGLSAITRCPKNRASEGETGGVNFTDNDRLCLDGQKLKAVSPTTVTNASYWADGTEYRTEVESFQKVTVSGGIYTVKDKAGLIRTYGELDSNIKLQQADGTQVTRIWAAHKLEDRNDNYVHYHYAQDIPNGEYWLEKITYHNSINDTLIGEVEFINDDTRTDKTSGFAYGGAKTASTKRLSRIDVKSLSADGTLPLTVLRSYFLDYIYDKRTETYTYTETEGTFTHTFTGTRTQGSRKSQLQQVQQCDGSDRSAATCTPATIFDWEQGFDDYSGAYSDRQRGSYGAHIFVDFYGDGTRNDLVMPGRNLGQSSELLSTTYNYDMETAIITDLDANGKDDVLLYSKEYKFWTRFYADSSESTDIRGRSLGVVADADSPNAAFIDLTDDGKPDFLIEIDGKLKYHTNLGLSSSGVFSFIPGIEFGPAVDLGLTINEGQKLIPLEYDGDGFPELYVTGCDRLPTNIPIPPEPWVYYPTTGFNDPIYYNTITEVYSETPPIGTTYLTALDSTTSDNCADTAGILKWNGTAFVIKTTFDWYFKKWLDLNGDGLTDYLIHEGTSVYSYLNQGGRFVRSANAVFTNVADTTAFNRYKPVDFNRDGKTDLIKMNDNSWSFYKSSGSGTFTFVDQPSSSSFTGGVDNTENFIDYNGDGLLDIEYFDGTYLKIRLNSGGQSGKILKVTNAFGDETNITYSNMLTTVYSDDYTKDIGVLASGPGNASASAADNIIDIMPGSMQVVSAFTVSDGIGGFIRTDYGYSGAKVDKTGRGFLGFWQQRAINRNTGIMTISYHRQDFPYTGMVVASKQFLPDIDAIKSEQDAIALRNCIAYSRTDPVTAEEICRTYSTSGDFFTNNIWNDDIYTDKELVSSNTTNPQSIILDNNDIVFASLDSNDNVLASLVGVDLNKVRYLPSTESTTELTYDFGSLTTASMLLKRTDTSFTYDSYGCALTVNSTTTDPEILSEVYSINTTNDYAPEAQSVAEWTLCRITQAKVEHSGVYYGYGASINDTSQTRVSKFTYNGSGSIEKESVEPIPSAAGVYDDLMGPLASNEVRKTYGYDTHGNKTSETIAYLETDIEGNPPFSVSRTTTSEYDALGLYPTKTINQKGHSETYQTDYHLGARTHTTGPNGITSVTDYNSFGQVTRSYASRAAKYTDTEYLWCSNNTGIGLRLPNTLCDDPRSVYSTINKDSAAGQAVVKTTEYDLLGRAIHGSQITMDGAMAYQTTHHDSAGRELLRSQPYFANQDPCYVYVTYDNLGRKTAEYMPADDTYCTTDLSHASLELNYGKKTTYVYKGLSSTVIAPKISTVIDATGRSVTRTNNVMGRLKGVCEGVDCEITDATSIKTLYDYDALGHTVGVKDAAPDGGNVMQMQYDNRGNKKWMNDPDMGVWTYQYNALGQLVSQTDAKLQTVRMAYDELGRMVERRDYLDDGVKLEGRSVWEYDTRYYGLGKLAAVTTYAASYSGTTLTETEVLKKEVFYNNYGELSNSLTTIDGKRFAVDTTYDRYGRAVESKYPSMDNSQVGYLEDTKRYTTVNKYNNLGFLTELYEGSESGDLLWRADAVDVMGNVVLSTLAGNVTEEAVIDRASGYLDFHSASTTAGMIVNQKYNWDLAGNLTERVELHINRRETFTYDDLYRLDTVKLFDSATGGLELQSDTHTYDEIGNLLSKGARFSDYKYKVDGMVGGPHAVKTIQTNLGVRSYIYDPNGNITDTTGGGDARSVSWTSFNKPKEITKGSDDSSTFFYGDDRGRYKQIAVNTEVISDTETIIKTDTTLYIGGVYEWQKKDVDKGTLVDYQSNVEHHHYVRAGGRVLAIAKRYNTSTTTTLNVLHRDHQGSVVAITDRAGGLLERMSYDAWGKRRAAETLAGSSAWLPSATNEFLTATLTKRGYTGHEMLDNVGLVHMNGRVYDAEIGRFLSADPNIQFAQSTQGFNRYTYVANNPLSYNDPSGFFLKKLLQAAFTIGSILFPPTSFFSALMSGFISGFALSGGNFKAGLIGAFSAGIFKGIGDHFTALAKANVLGTADAAYLSAGQFSRKVLAHGLAGGAMSKAGGGRFGDGFLGSGVSAAFSPVVGKIGENNVLRVAVSAAIGGVSAKLGGGKFANGAISAAYGQLYNEIYHQNIGALMENPLSEGEVLLEIDRMKAEQVAVELATDITDKYGDPVTLIGDLGSRKIHAGDRILVQASSQVTPLNVDHVRVEVFATPLDADGNLMPTIKGTFKNAIGEPQTKPDFVLDSQLMGGSRIAREFVLPSNNPYGNQWTVNVVKVAQYIRVSQTLTTVHLPKE